MRTPQLYTIDSIVEILMDLTLVGEISNESLGEYQLSELYRLRILLTGLALGNAEGIIASPRLFNLDPVSSGSELCEKLGIPRWDRKAWATFPDKIFASINQDNYPQLDYRYAYTPIPKQIFEDNLPRPVLLYKYISSKDNFDEWHFKKIIDDWRVYSEPKGFVHSTLPIKDPESGIGSFQEAIWNNPFYWSALQLLILSDPLTGSTYEFKTSLALIDGFDQKGKLNIYLENQYICDFRNLLRDILDHFQWIWINKTVDVMHIFKLLYKIEVMDIERDGRAVLNKEFCKLLLESTSIHNKNYKLSRSPRDWIREVLMQREKKK